MTGDMQEYKDFDIEGAEWVDISVVGSIYEEQIDARSGRYRHRHRAFGERWYEGRPPARDMEHQ